MRLLSAAWELYRLKGVASALNELSQLLQLFFNHLHTAANMLWPGRTLGAWSDDQAGRPFVSQGLASGCPEVLGNHCKRMAVSPVVAGFASVSAYCLAHAGTQRSRMLQA